MADTTGLSEQLATRDNVARLLERLADNSLAARLVQAHRVADTATRASALKAILEDRLEEVRENLDRAEN